MTPGELQANVGWVARMFVLPGALSASSRAQAGTVSPALMNVSAAESAPVAMIRKNSCVAGRSGRASETAPDARVESMIGEPKPASVAP